MEGVVVHLAELTHYVIQIAVLIHHLKVLDRGPGHAPVEVQPVIAILEHRLLGAEHKASVAGLEIAVARL